MQLAKLKQVLNRKCFAELFDCAFCTGNSVCCLNLDWSQVPDSCCIKVETTLGKLQPCSVSEYSCLFWPQLRFGRAPT